jgi:vacuolar-type H+-ATPase subunit C/Vma6
VVIGYAGIRRVEVANLITLSEGIRAGAEAERIRTRLIPRADLESVYV